MNILLVAQCNKKALVETRRIIDQFAERRGDRVWQTPITQIGLTTLRKLLKKTARRNTAVVCHWIRSKNHSELLWIVGNAAKFNQQGAVPTNITRRDVLRRDDENHWHTAEDITLLAGIAALFHDFGKANVLFQNKLNPKNKLKPKNKQPKLSEPYRHEWVSLRMFAAFAGGLSDQQWLNKLAQVSGADNSQLIANLLKDHPQQPQPSPFNPAIAQKLAPAARAVAWLILTHHKLPQYPKDGNTPPRLARAEAILDRNLTPDWNSPQIRDSNAYEEDNDKPGKWKGKELQHVWDFKNKTPLLSATWRRKAQQLGQRALKRPGFADRHWLEDTFTLHLARLALMLADHHYSSLSANDHFWDKKYCVWANTDRDSGDYKQRLDEHLIGVYRHSRQLVRLLPVLRKGLSAIARHKALTRRTANRQFAWQDKAFDVARAIAEKSRQQGFFGINMASTGKGKTFANARIMYGLSDSKLGCRFNIALGLRTLTLQTGDALMARLQLENDDLAVLVGSQAVKQLYELQQKHNAAATATGSESQNAFLDDDQYVSYQGALAENSPLTRWLEKSPKLNQLVSAPVLVSTIDHIMPATESDRGGKQIAPMLRLLTADLVLDEIDDFDLADLPAICRLVNWAGLLGTRVLLSSATLPPALVTTLFEAYLAGRKGYQAACGDPATPLAICCGWFDEYSSQAHEIGDKSALTSAHNAFVDQRIIELLKAAPVRQAALVDVTMVSNADGGNPAVAALAARGFQSIKQLHQQHAITHPESGKRLSIGVLRMANIKPLVAVAKNLLQQAAPANCQIHYCVYHSKLPLVVRSAIEQQLDTVLRRDDPNAVWQQPSIRQAMAGSRAQNHIFVVLASPVCEVGRDHDHDWAIVEPSSMRSIIQLAGRVQRHRNQQPEQPNIHILAHNFKALNGQSPVFTQPGFETATARLNSDDLNELLSPEQYRVISAIGRIRIHGDDEDGGIADAADNLSAFEHRQLANRLFAGKQPASLWWQKPLHWSYEWQRNSRFRQSAPSDDYVLKPFRDGVDGVDEDGFEFHCWSPNGELKSAEYGFVREPPIKQRLAAGVGLWGEFDYLTLLAEVADKLDMDENKAAITFGTVSLEQQDLWHYDEVLGFYQAL